MPLIPYPGFINGTGQLPARGLNAERTVCMYPARTGPGTSKTQLWLRPTPGYDLFATLGAGPVRALYHQDGRCFAVSGDRFDELRPDGTVIRHGHVSADSRRATIHQNTARQLFITSAMSGSIFDLNVGGLTPITAPGFPSACLAGTFADQYFLALHNGTLRFSFSGIADGLSWSSIDIAQKQQTTDQLRTFIYHNKELWLFGSLTIEVWFNSGDARNPWTQQPILIEGGIGAADSLAEGHGSLFWLRGEAKHSREIVASRGYGAVPIGSPAVHAAINTYARIDDAIGWFCKNGEHGFYKLSFPTEKATWVFDTETKLWHEDLFWNTTTGEYEANLGRCYTDAFGYQLVGSRVDGRVFIQRATAKRHGTEKIRRMRQLPHLHKQGKTLFFNCLEIEASMGWADVDETAQTFLRYSNDGGHTFGSEQWATLGDNGDYGARLRYDRLGSTHDRAFQWVTDAEGFDGVWNAQIDVEEALY